MRLKELLCIHEYRLINRPIYNKFKDESRADVECIKCHAVSNRRIGNIKLTRTNYIWCDCGHDLVNSNSIEEEIEEGVYKYKCSKCSTISYFDFTIAYGPVEVDVNGNIITKERTIDYD